jgi:hypothetical protein
MLDFIKNAFAAIIGPGGNGTQIWRGGEWVVKDWERG